MPEAKGSLFVAVGLTVAACPVMGAGAARDLPDSFVPGSAFTITITLDPPPGTSVVALEDAPPIGWTVSNISNGGTFDSQSGKVKWGLFFAPSIPTFLTYDVLSSPTSSCFAGAVSFDGAESEIGGESCAASVPTVSTWGVICLALALLTAGVLRVQSVRSSNSKT